MHRAGAIARAVLLAAAVLSVSPAQATSVQKFSLKALAQRSSSIALAKVEAAESRWDESGKEIYTYVTLRVVEKVKGKKDRETVTLRQLGGQVGNIASIVPGMPSFKKGEEVVVFLTEEDTAGYPWVLGLQQGKYSVVSDASGAKQVRNELQGLTLVSPQGVQLDASEVTAGQSLDSFLESVRSELGNASPVEVDPTVRAE
jgi:hypothetical protein